MRVNFAFGDVLQLGGNHLFADGGCVVGEKVAVKVAEFVLDHAAGKVVEFFGHLLQILIVIAHGHLFGAHNIAVDAGNAEATFRVGGLFVALFQDFGIDEGAAEAFELVVGFGDYVAVNDDYACTYADLGSCQAAAVGNYKCVFQVLYKCGDAGFVV